MGIFSKIGQYFLVYQHKICHSRLKAYRRKEGHKGIKEMACSSSNIPTLHFLANAINNGVSWSPKMQKIRKHRKRTLSVSIHGNNSLSLCVLYSGTQSNFLAKISCKRNTLQSSILLCKLLYTIPGHIFTSIVHKNDFIFIFRIITLHNINNLLIHIFNILFFIIRGQHKWKHQLFLIHTCNTNSQNTQRVWAKEKKSSHFSSSYPTQYKLISLSSPTEKIVKPERKNTQAQEWGILV